MMKQKHKKPFLFPKIGGGMALALAIFVAGGFVGEVSKGVTVTAQPVKGPIVPDKTAAESVTGDPGGFVIRSQTFTPPNPWKFKNLAGKKEPAKYANVSSDNWFTDSLVGGTGSATAVQAEWTQVQALPPQNADTWTGKVDGGLEKPVMVPQGGGGAVKGTVPAAWAVDVKAQFKPTLVSHTVSAWPGDHTRLVVGVGEVVELRIQPAPTDPNVTVEWKIISGSGMLNKQQTDARGFVNTLKVFDKKTVASDPSTKLKIQAKLSNDPGHPLEITFTVMEPTGFVYAEIDEGWSKKLNDAIGLGALGAAMGIQPIKLGPQNVSFANVTMAEDMPPSSNATGWFKNHPNKHGPSVGGGHKHSFSLPGNWYDDRVRLANGAWGQYVPNGPGPVGTFTWQIRNQWRVVLDHSTGATLPTTHWLRDAAGNVVATPQVHTMAADGTIAITKFGVGVMRTIKRQVTYKPKKWGTP